MLKQCSQTVLQEFETEIPKLYSNQNGGKYQESK